VKFVCSRCAREEEVSTRLPKCVCGGLWNLSYEAPAYDASLIDRSVWSQFRYRAFMGLSGGGWSKVSLGEGMTGVVRFDENVLLKMEYCMPTLSFKDRGAAVLIAHCLDIGVRSVVQDSSGNAGNSVAACCAKAGIECEIFLPEGTSPQKAGMIRAHGAKVSIVPGSRDHCADVCRRAVEEEGKYYANHVYNPFFYEGTKTYVYEVFEQLGRIPACLVVPLGNGTLFLGVMQGLEELLRSGAIEKMPRILAVQSERCAPLALAAQRSLTEPEEISPAPTLAEGIAIGRPMRGARILELVRKHGAEVITAPEDGILPARKMLARKGVYCEHTSAASYAAYLAYCKVNGPLPDALIPMTGAGLKSDH